jgi:hypothetical protein
LSHLVEPARPLERPPDATAASAKSYPKRTIVDVLSLFHNQGMERFAVLRQALADKVKPPPAARDELSGHLGGEQEDDGIPKSRFAGVLVLLIPVAGLAWIGIGWALYRLVA